ncbi:MAG: aminotransferase class III-fold pyridoxal phosphate-dependent enzyme, partial [Acidobacteriota bacterium]|nr:aminotransferase class III-fold pyridoxal phosphate-dependent enzyme [Acidobacteriota bacterium]
MAGRYRFIREVRGEGLMVGVDLTIPGKEFVESARESGLLINCTHETVLRFLPPYIVTENEVDLALEILDRTFSALDTARRM